MRFYFSLFDRRASQHLAKRRMKQWPLYRTLARNVLRTHILTEHCTCALGMFSTICLEHCICMCEAAKMCVCARQTAVRTIIPGARSHNALRTIVGIPLSGLEWFIHVDQLFS